jgi:hypothetical protein
MRSFVVGLVAALFVALVAALVLDTIQKPADTAFTTAGARN